MSTKKPPRTRGRKKKQIQSESIEIKASEPNFDLEPLDEISSEKPIAELSASGKSEENQTVEVIDKQNSINSVDSNGPVEEIDMPTEATTVQAFGDQIGSPEPQNSEVPEPLDNLDLSDEEGSELIESKIQENIHHQTERLFDLIEKLDFLNQCNWSGTSGMKDTNERVAKLHFLRECANRIKNQSLDLPEFLERRPLQDQPEYGYIKRILRTWDEVKQKLRAANGIIGSLPAFHGQKAPQKKNFNYSFLLQLNCVRNKGEK